MLGEVSKNPGEAGLAQVEIAAVRPNPRQPRRSFDPERMSELVASIGALGVLVPIIVRPLATVPPTYELIAGERRWRAAAELRLSTVPAIVRNASDLESLELAVVENLQRANLDPIEEAMGFANLVEEYGYTQERLAERLGRSRPAVGNALRLLALPDGVKALMRDGSLSATHARALLAFPEHERLALAQRAARAGTSVRELERMAARRRAPAVPAKAPKRADIQAAERELRYHYGTSAAIVASARGGRIEFRYTSADELTRIVELLLAERVELAPRHSSGDEPSAT